MLKSYVALYKNLPAIFVNDSPILPAMAIGADNFAVANGFPGAGIRIYQTFYRNELSDDYLHMGWDGEDGFDYSRDEKLFAGMLKYIPDDGFILPVVGYLNRPPRKWLENNAKEMTFLNTGRFGFGPSPASEKFNRKSEEVISRYIDHFEKSVFRDRIIGYHIINGRSFEWLSWDWFRPNIIGFDDYSRPMLNEFHRWLREKYSDDVKMLQEAWKDESVNFNSASIPDVALRLGKNGRVLPGPDDGMQVSDYHTCYAETWANQTIRFCRAAKDAVNGSKIIAVFNGYNMVNCHDTYVQCIGQLAFQKLLKSSCVDVIMAPYSYENRSIGGCHFPQVCESSVILHGKVFMDQIDTRTAIVRPKQPQWGQPDTVEESIEMMKRDMGFAVTHGTAYQYFDMQNATNAWGFLKDAPHWWSHPDMKSMQMKLAIIAKKAFRKDSRSTAEIALFVDNNSYLLQYLNRGFGSLLINAQIQYEMDKISAPVDRYLLGDLPAVRNYKLYIFLNAFDIPDNILDSIKERIFHKGATAIYFYAPSCYRNRNLDIEGTGERIGISLAMDERKDYIHIDITRNPHPFTKGLDKKDYGSDIDPEFYRRTTAYFPENKGLFKFSPIFYSRDSDAGILGKIRANGQPGLCVKKWNNGVVVFSAAPLMPAGIIRNIASHVGVHLYTDNKDLVYANNNFVFVTSRTDGDKIIRLPAACNVSDGLTEQVIGNNVSEFRVGMKKYETRIFELR